MGQPLRVLLVEDCAGDAELVLLELRRAGFDPFHRRVETAPEIHAALEEEPWDLVISDHSLPHFTGGEVLPLIQSHGLDLPVILVSGTIGEEAAVAAMRTGAHDYFVKGSLARLGPAVARELRDAEERRARKQAEDYFQQSQKFIRQVAEATPDLLSLYEISERRVVYGNRKFHLALGSAGEDSAARAGDALFGLVHPEDAPAILPCFRKLAAAGDDEIVELECRLKHASGEWHCYAHRITVFTRDAGGPPALVLIASRDITEHKRLEQQFRQAQKMEAVGQLAGGVAHDFNNLLTIILGYGRLLAQRAVLDEPAKKNLEAVIQAGERAAGLTRQLLAFSRRQVLQPSVVNLNMVTAGVEKLLRRLIGEDIELASYLSPDLWNVKADPGQLEQVLMNLAVNARDAMPQGGRLELETRNVELDEFFVRQHAPMVPGSYVQLAVGDSGCGMDPSTLARIFEPFFTTKELGKGTGLGLSTVYGIVKQSGGYIWALSKIGQGTTFLVYLPKTEEAAEARNSGLRSALSPRGAETLLVIEDESSVRKLICQILLGHGYRVLEASRGEEALSIVQRHTEPIHLAITDVVMPGMSGPEVAQRILQLRPLLKVLFTSGYTDKTIQNCGLSPRHTHFIQKPFSPESLARKVREVLDLPAEEPRSSSP